METYFGVILVSRLNIGFVVFLVGQTIIIAS